MEDKFHEKAVKVVFKLETIRTRKAGYKPPILMDIENGTTTCGYDIKTKDRHIEVKSFTNKRSYVELTSTQTKIMKKDSKYFLYIVEKNMRNRIGADVFAIPQKEIIEMSKKIVIVRVNGIQNQTKKERWRLK
jgi:hypothetical protein